MVSIFLALALSAAASPGAAHAVSVTEGTMPEASGQERKRVEIGSDNVDLSGAGWLDFTADAAPVVKAMLGAPITQGKGEIVFNHAGRAIGCMAGSSGLLEKAEEALCEQIEARARFHLNFGYDLPFEVGRLAFSMRLKNVLTPRRPVVVRPPGRGFDVTVMTTGKSGAAGCSIVNSPFSAADNETVCTAWVEAGRPGLLGRKSPPAAAQRKPLAPRTPASTPPRTPARGGLAQISVSLGKNSWEIAVVERPIWRNMDIVYPGLPTSTLTPIMSFEGSVKSSIDSLDYPRLALIEGLEGKVLALVGFGREGTPLSCRPLQSSGTAFLDNATCEVIMRRLRYDFASEIPQFSGKRYYVANVRWVMPTDQDD